MAENKFLIEYSNAPLATDLATNIIEWEKCGLDGIAYKLCYADPDTPLGSGSTSQNQAIQNRVFHDYAIPWDDIKTNANGVDVFNAIDFSRFQHNFLQVDMAPASIDWFHDKNFEIVKHNFYIAARAARETFAKGIFLDFEPASYSHQVLGTLQAQLWKYDHLQGRFRGISHADYRAKIKQRARELTRILKSEFPGIIVICTVGYDQAYENSGNLSYELFSSFLDGMWEEKDEFITIVDGYEASYSHQTAAQYIADRAIVDALYVGKDVEIGAGIWMDYDSSGSHTWGYAAGSSYHTPSLFKNAIINAAENLADRYIWIYSQIPRFFNTTGTPSLGVPASYISAINDARLAIL